MLQMIAELTKGWFFLPMSDFTKLILNGEEVLKAIDATDCIEFGTFNRQQLIIYDLSADGRKHIRYSCTMTTLYDYIVLENVYSQNGNEYTDFNWEKWYNIAGEKAAASS